MAREDNLMSVEELNAMFTPEQRSANARKAGLASAEAKRKRKTIKEQMELLLSLPLKDEKAKQQLEALGIDTENVDNQMAMIIAQWRTALKGGMAGVNAFNSIQASVGEQPVNKQEINGNIPVVIDDDIKE